MTGAAAPAPSKTAPSWFEHMRDTAGPPGLSYVVNRAVALTTGAAAR